MTRQGAIDVRRDSDLGTAAGQFVFRNHMIDDRFDELSPGRLEIGISGRSRGGRCRDWSGGLRFGRGDSSQRRSRCRAD
jgi:hypothetical protein